MRRSNRQAFRTLVVWVCAGFIRLWGNLLSLTWVTPIQNGLEICPVSLSISPMPFNCCSVVRSNEQGHFCMEIQQKLIKAERESLLCSDERKAFSPLFNNHPFNSREEQTRAMLCGCLLILFCISISQVSYFINLTFFTICHFSFWCLSCSFSLAVQS